MFSKQLLRHLFDYDAVSGRLIYRANRGKWSNKGKPAGDIGNNGYIRISICGKRFLLHRLVWTYHNGDIPDGLVVDHLDRNPLNNQIENLRVATTSQNVRNKGLFKTNTSGYTGVHKNNNCSTWYANIWDQNKLIYLGSFPDFEGAKAARQQAELKYGYPVSQAA